MRAALTKLLVERERLIARNDRQRDAIGLACRQLDRPAAIIDRGIACARFVRDHPAAMAGIAAAIVVLRTRSVSAIAIRGLGVWRLVRRARSIAHLIGF